MNFITDFVKMLKWLNLPGNGHFCSKMDRCSTDVNILIVCMLQNIKRLTQKFSSDNLHLYML
jgi:hypothetical protein